MLGRLFAACLILASQIMARQKADDAQTRCLLEGTAVDFATAEPLRKVTIRLVPATGAAPGQMAVTDASGHFHLEGIPEGNYELTGERPGYLKGEFGARRPAGTGTPLHLKAGDKLTGLVLKLAHCSIITGKVSDENGEPVARAVVYAVWRDWIHGQQFYFRSQGTWTNDAGEYRITDLPPRRYYLCAESSSESFVEKPGGPEKQLVWSFYPGSRTLDGASLLDLQLGQNLAGVDFQSRPEPVFHIRGKMVGKDLHDPENRLELSARPHNSGDGIIDLDSGGKEDASFDFSGAPAGDYDLQLQSDMYQQTIAKWVVNVKKSDVNGLVLQIPSKFALKGVVHRLESTGAAASQLLVLASDSGSPLMSHPYTTKVEPDGSFRLENMWPGKYVFSLFGQEALGVPVEIAGSAGPVEITLSGGAGQIEGSVQSADSDVSRGGLSVVLVSEAARADAVGVLLAQTDQNGHVAFENVTPGRYRAFAVADLDSGLLSSRSFIGQFQGHGAEVEMPENGHLRIRIPIVPADDVQRALSTLGL